MGGFVLDIVVEYFYRAFVAFARRIQSRSWPTANATVTRAWQPRKIYGCKLVSVRYHYYVAGEKYAATHNEPFLIDSPGSFLRRYVRGTDITVRYKADEPGRSIALVEPTD